MKPGREKDQEISQKFKQASHYINEIMSKISNENFLKKQKEKKNSGQSFGRRHKSTKGSYGAK